MKKLAVLLLVLSVASLAQASFFLTINGADATTATVNVGQTVTVGLNSTDLSVVPDPTAVTAYGMYGCMTILAAGPGWSSDWAALTNPVMNANMGSGAIGWQNAYPYSNIAHNGWNYANPVPSSAGLWAEWTYTATQAGAVELFLLTWDPAYSSTFWDKVDVTNVVPEPTTITMLGLGLVALFRKK